MHDNAAVTEEGAEAGHKGGVGIVVARREGRAVRLAVLAAQVPDLARCRLRSVAWRVLAPHKGILVRERCRAIAVGGHRLVVDVVHCVTPAWLAFCVACFFPDPIQNSVKTEQQGRSRQAIGDL